MPPPLARPCWSRKLRQADTWYTGSDGGQRIIYQPREIHPWNHFSTASTKDAIEFYATAFADQSGLVQNIASTSQIWYWKEVFELVALVGFLLMLAPLALLLMKLPFLSNAKQAVAAPTRPSAPCPASLARSACSWSVC